MGCQLGPLDTQLGSAMWQGKRHTQYRWAYAGNISDGSPPLGAIANHWLLGHTSFVVCDKIGVTHTTYATICEYRCVALRTYQQDWYCGGA